MERQSKRAFVGFLALVCIPAVRVWGALTAPTAVPISPTGEICHDFPDVVVTSSGASAVAAWMGYDFNADEDQLYTAALSGTTWAPAIATGITGDLFCPRLGNAGASGVHIVWAKEDSENWDLFTRPLAGGTITQLTTDPGSDLNAATASDPSRERFFVVWQGFRSGRSAIFLMMYQSGSWGPAKVVSQPAANEWFPKAAVDSTGRVWIAWDSYRNGNYDVFLRSYWPDGDAFTPEIQVTANLKFEGNVSVACDSDNRVWMAWEIGKENWGKDQGRLTTEGRLNMPVGKTFMNNRRIAMGVYDGAVKTTAVGVNTSIPLNTFDPIMAVDAHDRAWVFHAQKLVHSKGTSTGWRYAMTRYDDKVTTWSWDTAVIIPANAAPVSSLARVERKLAVARYDDNRLLAVYHVDGRRSDTNTANDIRHGPPDGNRIYAALAAVPSVTDEDPPLTTPAVDPAVQSTHPTEPADVAAMRAYDATINGRTYQLLRGDFHRHTDTSWDGNGDGSLEDLYRYAYDVATLDFVLPTDHHTQLEGNSQYPNWNFYPWRRTQEYDELYYSPGVMASFFGYERSRTQPDGHRNVAYPTHGPKGDWIVHSQTGAPPLDEDYLWNAVVGRGGITIPHTSGNKMGTDWSYDVNTSVETVVEIYQGCRYSYENYVDDRMWPNVDRRGTPSQTNEEIYPEGYYFSMLSARVGGPTGDFRNKLGIISSSDHTATHLSYACIYTEDASREGILAAIKARHTYGAMDNIILDVRCGTAMMGDEIALSEPPTIDIFVDSPKPLNEVALIRDNAVLYTWDPSIEPDPTQFSGSYTDSAFTPGYHYYYVRARQNDGSDAYGLDGTMAWSSPLWIQNTGTRVNDWRGF